MTWNIVCRLDDILPNTGVGALVNGQQIALFRLEDDRVFAIDNYCPFSQANVLSRGLIGELNGALCVASPVYKQHFRLEDGVCLEDAAQSVHAYAVRVGPEGVAVALGAPVSAAA
ncbi:MAG: nitrite reductase small subunit NirD [Oceanococcaceae bacterium]